MSAGLDLSRRYWQQCGLPALEKDFAPLINSVAAGMIGEGSECFGYDDEISRDHDWGPAFCLFVSQTDYDKYGDALKNMYASLPKTFEGVAVKQTPWRSGVFVREKFFEHFIGRIPQNSIEWLQIPEQYLSVCTAGEIFYDNDGATTELINTLRSCPKEVRIKKLAARCAAMAQAGQYNYARCKARSEALAAQLALQNFADAAASAAFLLNNTWMPFYKWMPRALRGLAHLSQLEPLLLKLFQPDLIVSTDECILQICIMLANEMRRQQFTDISGCDMQQIALDIQAKLTEPALRALPLLVG